MFDYLAYRNTFPVDLFSVGKLPTLNPYSTRYKDYWRDQKRKCIEGYWVEHEGFWKWMTGPAYFYTNFWHILRNDSTGKSKTKGKARPLLRDLEWIKSYVYSTVRGFSGFEGDNLVSCHRCLLEDDKLAAIAEQPFHVQQGLLTDAGDVKSYMPALEYLYQYFPDNLGKPLHYNYALNIVDIESRGGGKSYTSSGMMIGHNFLFDGAMDYDEWVAKQKEKSPLSSETLVGGIDTKYTKDLISKIKFGLENLEGGFMYAGVNYAPPLSKKYTDDWSSGSTVVQVYKKKSGGRWVEAGSRSKIQHRTFKDNAFAANGTRASVNVLDEIGFMGNLQPVLGQMAECTADGSEKFGTIWMPGTGGNMEGGATQAVQGVFYDPEANSCLGFDDIFEGSEKKIGFFVPAWMTLNQYKDALGNTDRERAMKFLLGEREKKAAAKSKKPLNDELQQRPIVPSEAFLITAGNVFPTAELKAHLGFLESSRDGDVLGQVGTLTQLDGGQLKWSPCLDKRLRALDYPVKEEDDLTGAIQIWEHPEEGVGYGVYIGGCDPVDQERGPNSASLGSIFILRRATPGTGSLDKLVAEYSARPESAGDFHENCRKLITYYNGQLLYENNLPGLKAHFERQHSLRYLAYTPGVLKANVNSQVARTYGQHMVKAVKEELEIATRDWLLMATGEGRLNLHQICSVPLLKELIAYNDHGNFDRVIAFMLCICMKMELHSVVTKKREALKKDPFFTRRYAGGN